MSWELIVLIAYVIIIPTITALCIRFFVRGQTLNSKDEECLMVITVVSPILFPVTLLVVPIFISIELFHLLLFRKWI